MSGSGTSPRRRMRRKPWVIPTQCPHQPGHNGTISEGCGQSMVRVTGCADSPRQMKAVTWVQSASSEPSQKMGPEARLETRLQHRSKVHPGAGARDKTWEGHTSSRALARRRHPAWPEMGSWTHRQKGNGPPRGGCSGQLRSWGALRVLTLN